jgi:hypothetical protein
VVKVTIKDREAAEAHLRDVVVPRASQSPGFVGGYWTRKDNEGLSMIVFESEDQARAVSEQIQSMVPESVALDGVEVREVAASA